MSVQPVTDETFEAEVLDAKTPVFIDLWAEWCGPCRSLAPTIEELSEQYGDRVKFVSVNVDQNPAVSEAFQVQSIPLMAIVQQRRLIDTAMGALPKHQLSGWLDTILEQLANGLLEKAGK